jgi:hypothetical protein
MKIYLSVCLVLLCLGLVGCADVPVTQFPTQPAPATQAPKQPATVTPVKGVTEVPQKGTTIAYRRSGGFAGVNDYLVIEANGSARLTRKNGEASFVVTQDELGQLTALLEQSGFSTLNSNNTPGGIGADRFEYEITYQGHTVRTMDGAVPPTLVPVLGRLNDLLAKSQVS